MTLLGTPIQLHAITNIYYSVDNMAETQDDLLKFRPSIRMVKKSDLGDWGVVVGARPTLV